MKRILPLLFVSCSGSALAPDELTLGYSLGEATSEFDGPRASFDSDEQTGSVHLTWHLTGDVVGDLLRNHIRMTRILLQERQGEAPPAEAPPCAPEPMSPPGPPQGAQAASGLVQGVSSFVDENPTEAVAGLLALAGAAFGAYRGRHRIKAWAKRRPQP